MSKFKATGTEITSYPCPIEPLQPQLSREKLPEVSKGWKKLLVNADKVNQLSEQLEAALFELKLAASEIKCDRPAYPLSNQIFQHKFIVIPCIHYPRPGSIVVTTRKIDLFQQERETLQVAQMLRQRTRRRLKRPIPTALLKSSKPKNPNFARQLVLTWQKLNLAIGRKPTIRDRSPKVNKPLSC